MFKVSGRTILISNGDTGLITFVVEKPALTDRDRAVFTVRRSGGGLIMEKTIEPDLEKNTFTVPLLSQETERIAAGEYEWDVRFVLDAVVSAGRVTDGREVSTPFPPGMFRVMKVVGRV